MTDDLRTTPDARPFRRTAHKRRFPWLIAPAAGFYLIFFGCPLAQMIWQSLWSEGFTLSGYLAFASESAYWWMLGYTLVLEGGTMLLVLVVAYPVAYWLVCIDRRYAVLLMGLGLAKNPVFFSWHPYRGHYRPGVLFVALYDPVAL